MNIKHFTFILFLLLPLMLSAQKRSEVLEKQLEVIKENPNNHDAMLTICEHYLKHGDYSKVVTYAEYLKNQTNDCTNPYILLNAHLYLGRAQMMSGREKVARKNLDAAFELATSLKNDTLLCILYGALGEYSANIDADYYQAIRWIYKGIEVAQHNHLKRQDRKSVV